MNNYKNTTALAFLLGAATGGIAALLLAPTSGKDLRERIGAQTEKAGTEAARLASETRIAAVEGYRKVTRSAEQAVDGTKTMAAAGKKAVVDAVAEGKAAYEREIANSN